MCFNGDNVVKVCPFMMMANAIKGPDADGNDTVDINCIGESCMMWNNLSIGGYCGLCEKPEIIHV